VSKLGEFLEREGTKIILLEFNSFESHKRKHKEITAAQEILVTVLGKLYIQH
jgi:hypothetical protein